MKRTGLIIVALLWLVVGCENKNNNGTSVESCGDKEKKILIAAEKGDLKTVKNYLENGGDPFMSCTEGYSGGPYGGGIYNRNLPESIRTSHSYELVKYYLTYRIPSEIKDEMLTYYADDDETDGKIIQLLVENGAHITEIADHCITARLRAQTMRNLAKYNYDFDWKDPIDGNTLLMKYCLCPAHGEESDMITMITLLDSLGAAINLPNKEGKVAEEIAINPKIRDFLKSL